jgi:RNA polymerase sigma factor (sigma-70 family)
LGKNEASRTASRETLALLARARGGDSQAREELFERLLPRVRRIASLRMGCRESELWEREDLVQETLIDALRSLATFEARHEGALCHWLATLVQNNLNDHRRRRKAKKRDARRVVRRGAGRSTVLTDSVLGTDTNTPSRIASAAELEERVELALLALDEPKRRAIELRRLCELSFEEIADTLGLGGASSARSLFSRAMADLAGRL